MIEDLKGKKSLYEIVSEWSAKFANNHKLADDLYL
jgi:hypothetical protein